MWCLTIAKWHHFPSHGHTYTHDELHVFFLAYQSSPATQAAILGLPTHTSGCDYCGLLLKASVRDDANQQAHRETHGVFESQSPNAVSINSCIHFALLLLASLSINGRSRAAQPPRACRWGPAAPSRSSYYGHVCYYSGPWRCGRRAAPRHAAAASQGPHRRPWRIH